MTHPFHPLYKQKYEIVTIRQNWGEQRVYYYDSQNKLKSFPLSWTSAQPVDVFVKQAKGRSHFRMEDLLELRVLLDKRFKEPV